ncbi:hypothetical protein Slin15195_G090510 [Septoria linicola]|uniref:F-box domain-containing protein n=1 Tax=Septoria linicola TaxID=215465 RepID=A0A9Q9ATW7_9PEZI|nr:hypothetical protein Slin15195_G090510 [Septoria linicola]
MAKQKMPDEPPPANVDQRTAAEVVLGVTELLERILLQLDTITLYGVKRVSRGFKDTIDVSVLLRQKLHPELKDGDDERWVEDWLSHPKMGAALFPFVIKEIEASPKFLVVNVMVNRDWYFSLHLNNMEEPHVVRRDGLACEKKTLSWNTIRMAKGKHMNDLWLDIPLYGSVRVQLKHGDITLRDILKSCWRAFGAYRIREYAV